MFCSAGLSRLPNGRPYWIPIRRSAAARPSSAKSGLNLRRRATDEVGDLLRVDQHRVDARSLEGDHVLAGGGREVGDRELPGRDVGQEVEDPLDVLLVVLGVPWREEEDLRVDAVERRRQRVVVVDVGDDLQAERAGALVKLL